MAPPFFPPKNTKRISNNTIIPQIKQNFPNNTKVPPKKQTMYFLGGKTMGPFLYFLGVFLSFFGGDFCI
jgi:hypothetical protein